MKKCTWCGKEYEGTATVCAIDSRPLEAVALPLITQHRQSLGADEKQLAQQSLLFPRQIGRFAFVVRYVLFMVAIGLSALLLSVGTGMQSGFPAIAVLALSVVTLLVALFYFIRHDVVARLRDIGIHGLFALLIFVPIVNLLFLLIEMVPEI